MSVALLIAFITLFTVGPAIAQQSKLFIYNWSEYMDPAIIKTFEDKYHVKVVQSFFNSNTELFAKLRTGGDGQYDIIVPSNYFVPRLIRAGLVQPLNKKQIPNLDNLMPKFRDPNYDPNNEYSVAYQWGDTGIVYNTNYFPDPPDSWAIIFDPSINKKYPFSITKDAQGNFAAACAYLGEGYTCDKKDSWIRAAELLRKTKQRANFAGFAMGTPSLNRLARGTVDVAVTYNGDYIYRKKLNPDGFADTKFVVPKEGAELWIDVMAIPAHAPHPKLANKFINFILNLRIGAKLSNFNSYASPNEASQPYLDHELREPPIMPTAAEMKRLHTKPILKGKKLQLQQQLWTEVKSQ